MSVCPAADRGHPLPRFVESTMRDFLACGLFEYGFVSLQCTDCGTRRAVAFSCKRRRICSSCQARRMSETAAHLAQRVVPEVPVRQWVLSLPFPLRYRLAYDRELTTPIHGALRGASFCVACSRSTHWCAPPAAGGWN